MNAELTHLAKNKDIRRLHDYAAKKGITAKEREQIQKLLHPKAGAVHG